MNFLLIIPYYFSWHYGQGILDYFKVWKNLIWFLWNFFSIKVLSETFFMPFQKLKEDYSGGLDIENFLSSIVVTTLMRMVGMFLRSVIIITGLISIFSFVILGLMGMIVWLTLPLIIVWFVITSIISLLK